MAEAVADSRTLDEKAAYELFDATITDLQHRALTPPDLVQPFTRLCDAFHEVHQCRGASETPWQLLDRQLGQAFLDAVDDSILVEVVRGSSRDQNTVGSDKSGGKKFPPSKAESLLNKLRKDTPWQLRPCQILRELGCEALVKPSFLKDLWNLAHDIVDSHGNAVPWPNTQRAIAAAAQRRSPRPGRSTDPKRLCSNDVEKASASLLNSAGFITKADFYKKKADGCRAGGGLPNLFEGGSLGETSRDDSHFGRQRQVDEPIVAAHTRSDLKRKFPTFVSEDSRVVRGEGGGPVEGRVVGEADKPRDALVATGAAVGRQAQVPLGIAGADRGQGPNPSSSIISNATHSQERLPVTSFSARADSIAHVQYNGLDQAFQGGRRIGNGHIMDHSGNHGELIDLGMNSGTEGRENAHDLMKAVNRSSRDASLEDAEGEAAIHSSFEHVGYGARANTSNSASESAANPLHPPTKPSSACSQSTSKIPLASPQVPAHWTRSSVPSEGHPSSASLGSFAPFESVSSGPESRDHSTSPPPTRVSPTKALRSARPLPSTGVDSMPSNESSPHHISATQQPASSPVFEPVVPATVANLLLHADKTDGTLPQQTIPPTTPDGELNSLQPGRWLSALAIARALYLFNPDPQKNRIFESGCIDLSNPQTAEPLGKRARQDSAQTLMLFPMIVDNVHCILGIVDFAAETIELYDARNAWYLAADAALRSFVRGYQGKDAELPFGTVTPHALVSNAEYECGICVVVQAIHRMHGRPCPASIIPGVWRRALSFCMGREDLEEPPPFIQSLYRATKVQVPRTIDLNYAATWHTTGQCLTLLGKETNMIFVLFNQSFGHTKASRVIEYYETKQRDLPPDLPEWVRKEEQARADERIRQQRQWLEMLGEDCEDVARARMEADMVSYAGQAENAEKTALSLVEDALEEARQTMIRANEFKRAWRGSYCWLR